MIINVYLLGIRLLHTMFAIRLAHGLRPIAVIFLAEGEGFQLSPTETQNKDTELKS